MCQHLLDRTRPKSDFVKPMRIIGYWDEGPRVSKPWIKSDIIPDEVVARNENVNLVKGMIARNHGGEGVKF